MNANEVLDMLQSCGVEMTCLLWDRHRNHILRNEDEDTGRTTYDLEPIWPVLSQSHPDHKFVSTARNLWQRSKQFRHWLDHAHMIREMGLEGENL